MKVTVYVGNRNMAGEMENIRRWNDLEKDEQARIGQILQQQCAKVLGYQMKKAEIVGDAII